MLWLLIIGFYPYLMYPVLVWALSRLYRMPVRLGDFEPTVTVVIAAYNEAKTISDTIQNKLNQEYTADKVTVVVVSDCSNDGTDEIVQELMRSDSRVKLIRQCPRQGKTSGLNLALREAESEIVIFSDANSMYGPGALKALVKNFNDERVGYVTGRMTYIAEVGSVAGGGSSAFMRYENFLRELETAIGSVVGVDGGIDAIRRNLYIPMRMDQLPDFVLPMAVVLQGYRVVYEKDATVAEHALRDSGSEYRMRVRVATRAFWALIDNLELANPFRHGIYAWQLVSHKWLRYLSFLPLGAAVVVAFLGSETGTLETLLRFGILLFFVFALLGVLFPIRTNRLAFARWCSYFLLLNLASAVAVMNVIRGERVVTWTPRKG